MRSRREVEAHTADLLGNSEQAHYLMDKAADLLASLRLWAQSKGRTDDEVRAVLEDVLEDVEPMTGHLVGTELMELHTEDADTAARKIGSTMRLPLRDRSAIIGTALQVWRVSSTE